MAPIKKQFGWRTAALAQERAMERRMAEGTVHPTTVAVNLTVNDKIAARKERTLASLGPKAAAGVRALDKAIEKEGRKKSAERRERAANQQIRSCLRQAGGARKDLVWRDTLVEQREITKFRVE
ncbi:MAG: hypothetical protein Q9220_007332 [cf. Caloplaca sp. 1 TL-2023]